MVFVIKNKVALITGGASGIGLQIAKELLREGAKAVTLADVDPGPATDALEEIKKEFGADRKALFVKADVSRYDEFENALRTTVERFGNVDVLINNAGIRKDGQWEREVELNLKAVCQGMILAINKYLPKHQQGPEALILNVSCVSALEVCPYLPVYSGTKIAALAFTRNWGQEFMYNETKVRVLCVCLGDTSSSFSKDSDDTLGKMYDDIRKRVEAGGKLPLQGPNFVAKETIQVMKFAPSGSIWVIENAEPAYEYVVPHRNAMKGNVLS